MCSELVELDRDDDAAVDDYHAITATAQAADLPDLPPLTRAQVAARIRHPPPTIQVRDFVVRHDGRPAAALLLELPGADNPHAALVELTVHPAARRRGVGRAAFAAAVTIAREHGRTLLLGSYTEALPGGPSRDPGPAAFALAVGAKPGLTEIRRRLRLDTVDRDGWQTPYDEARSAASGYSVVWWAGGVPEDLLAGVAYLESRLGSDAPQGDLRYEPENFDADRIRGQDEMLGRRGMPQYHAGALDDVTGRLVAWTHLVFSVGDPAHAWQGTTLVDPDHRGHRLGLLVKLENLRRTLEVMPELESVDTWNAEENAHMIAINEAIGFRPVDATVIWQYDIPVAP